MAVGVLTASPEFTKEIYDGVTEASLAARLFDSFGIAKERIVLEDKSRDTDENARFTRGLIQPKPGERWLLVTSAFHMPRAVGLFRKAGFAVDAYPVDWKLGKGSDIFTFFNIAGDGLSHTDPAIREWMGLIAYRLAGKTDAFLPGPGPK